MKIAYLNAEASSGLGVDHNGNDFMERLHKRLLEHPEVEWYSLEDFCWAFNTEVISDQGYITTITDEQWEERRAKNNVIET